MNDEIMQRLSVITEEEEKLLNGGNLNLDNYTDSLSHIVDSKNLIQDGSLITIRPNTRFTSFPKHRHNYIEIVYMCSGQQKHIINGTKEIVLKQGELLLLNQHAYHQSFYAGKNDIAINFIIVPAFFDTIIEMIGSENKISEFLVSDMLSKKSTISYMHYNVSDVLPIQNLLENLIWSIINKQANSSNLNKYTMGLIFLHLLNFTDKLFTDEPQKFSTSIVMSTLKEIEQNYVNANLANISKNYHVTAAYVSKIVKQKTGKTFKQLLMEKRITKAASLLINTKLPISDIIVMVGYENTTYFYKIFTEQYGMSPKLYRNFKVK